jgi:dCMP deaminase
MEENKVRPSFEDIYMRLASMMAERSTCRRLAVGCAIVTPDFRQVLAVGYNGSAAGLKNDCDRIGEAAVGNCGCIHAEQNAVINCNAKRSEGKIVFCTHLPCVTCAKFLINLGGVTEVFFLNDYRIRDSVDLLKQVGIQIAQFVPGRLQ